MSRTYHITTFGCQMNQADTEMMEGIMAARGMSRAADEQSADVILYNTCVVREHAEERALMRLSQLQSLKRANPERIIGVTGCMAQKEAERLHERMPHIDIVMGTRAIPRFGLLLDAAMATGQPQTCVEILDEEFPAGTVPVRLRKLKGFINIILGCNKNCSYCIVPTTRGRESSIAPEAIVKSAEEHIAAGCREITLIGQNVNSYSGVAADGVEVDFGGLLRRVDKVCDGIRIRYVTSHPRDCNDSHISAVAECRNVCEQFHLPVQSGSTAVLRKMYRGYSRERYLRLVDRVRAAVPNASVSTDIIVGFPGETEADFEQTLALVREVRFDAAYMYMYSTRPGTPAAEKFEDHMPLGVKKERLTQLIALQEKINLESNRKLIGSRANVLIEDLAPRTPGDLLARTRGDKMVIMPGPPERIGRYAEVEIHDANGHTLLARPVVATEAESHDPPELVIV